LTSTTAPGGSLGAATPTGTQGFPEATGTQEAPVEQGTPTVTPTLGLVHTQMEPSDPKEFRIASGQVQLVELFAVWSPASKSMTPVMYILEEKYKDRIHFVYLDIDDPSNGIFKSLLQNRLPPVFFLLDGEGNVMHEWQGSVRAEDFETVLDTVP